MKRFLGLLVFLVLAALPGGAQSTPAMDEAAAAAAAGRTDEAIRGYQAVLEREPENAEAMSALGRLLESRGRWHEAVPVLEKLVKLQPQNSAALYQLGSMKSWLPDQRKQALDLLNRACETSGHNPEYCGAYAEVLSWNEDSRVQAIAQLRQTVAAHPEAASARLRLAEMLSWNTSTRVEAIKLFNQGLEHDPNNVELLIASAQVLSWNHETRLEALARYNRVLQQNPDEPRALNGKAQLLAWQSRTAEALELYQRVLAKDPHNPAALRGKAEILNWKGRYSEARGLAQEAHTLAPSDANADLELARADIGLHRFVEARDAISGVGTQTAPGLDETRQEIHRGLGTYLELGYVTRREQDLEFDRPTVTLSTAATGVSRLSFTYMPSFYSAPGQGFNANYFQTTLDSGLSDRVTTHVQGGVETFDNAAVNWDGAAEVRFKPVSSTLLKFGFQRAPIEESFLSTRGENVSGLGFAGQVHSNLADVGVNYYNNHYKFDVSLDYYDGVYTGSNLDSNRRYSIEGQIGEAVHSDLPYVRVAYGVTYLSFAHDADLQTGQPITRQTGGYFSPTQFLLNQGMLNISHRFSPRVEWAATGAAGVQNVGSNTATFSNSQFASSFETHLRWRVSPVNELMFGYEYLNVYNAFQRNLYRFAWRHYF
jgi:tetratricopeptide (TPR) repeat protein